MKLVVGDVGSAFKWCLEAATLRKRGTWWLLCYEEVVLAGGDDYRAPFGTSIMLGERGDEDGGEQCGKEQPPLHHVLDTLRYLSRQSSFRKRC